MKLFSIFTCFIGIGILGISIGTLLLAVLFGHSISTIYILRFL